MTISYPLTLPSAGFREVTWTVADAVAFSRSPFTFAGQAQDWGGQMWAADVTLPELDLASGRQWTAFFLGIRGQFGTFLMGDPLGVTPGGVGGGIPVVDGSGQGGGNLAVSGAPVSTNGWLLKGDYIQLGAGSGARLYQLVSDANTDGSGSVSLDIWPNLREAPTSNEPVIVNGAQGLWRLSGNQRKWRINEAGHYGIQFSAMEAL